MIKFLMENVIRVNIKIFNCLAKKEDLFIKADQKAFSQIILNLLNNAIKYNRESGSITVNASDSRAYYTKVGRAVHWMTRMVVSAISSPSGTLHINGLPFTSFNPGGDSNTCQAGQFMENVNSSNIGEDIIGSPIFLKYSAFPETAELTIKYPFNVNA